ncbi:unnamed protein product, partial [Oppiella nova]
MSYSSFNNNVQKRNDNGTKTPKKTSKNILPSDEFHLSILGNGSKGNPRALYVWTNGNTYLFNCGDGTQRMANEHKHKLSKLENVFITRRCIENMSGLIGLALTCHDIGVSHNGLTLHGPLDADCLINRYHDISAEVKIQTNSYIDYNFEDTDLVVKCVPIYPSVAVENSVKTSKTLSKDPNDISFVYICKLKDRP